MDVNESIEYIRMLAGQARFGNEVFLNVKLTTWEQSMGFEQSVHTLDLVDTTRKFREMGVIQ